MVCIYCGSKTKVTNSRPQLRLGQTWRRRECQRCHALFSTTEQTAYTDVLRVKKRSGALEYFERDKLYLSIYRSCEHIPGAVSTATDLTQTVIARLMRKKPMSPIISSFDIAATTSEVLKRYNAAANIKYLSFQTDMAGANAIRKKLKSS